MCLAAKVRLAGIDSLMDYDLWLAAKDKRAVRYACNCEYLRFRTLGRAKVRLGAGSSCKLVRRLRAPEKDQCAERRDKQNQGRRLRSRRRNKGTARPARQARNLLVLRQKQCTVTRVRGDEVAACSAIGNDYELVWIAIRLCRIQQAHCAVVVVDDDVPT